VLVDANLLLYSVDTSSPFHEKANDWLTTTLNRHHRVGIPWTTLGAFLRISTHPRITARPLSATQAWQRVENWLGADCVWVPPATGRTAAVLGRLLTTSHITGNLVPDAMLAALAIEHGLEVATADTDFGRFREVRWANPLLV